MENTGRRKFIFDILIFCILAVMAIIGYLLFSQKKLASRNQTSVVFPSSETKVTSKSSPAPKFSNKQEISVGKQGFNPAVIKIKVGTLVNWFNKRGKEAAIVSNPPSTHDAYPALNLGRFPDGSGVSVIFDGAGTYGYYNYLHPEQTGTIVVE